ncbi:MAG: type II secretion system protein GspL [Proteobacteria bacterium]|nr:type II secretion system protein GspL [Pseudomonadota bacterium]
MSKLFLRLTSKARALDEGFEIRCDWLISDANGSIRGEGSTDYRGLIDLADEDSDWLNNPENVVVFLPDQFVLNVSCEVPGRSSGQIRRALPYAVEEFVASDIEAMHLAHGPIVRSVPIRCALVNREMLETWIACLASAGLNPGYLLADSEVLTPEPNGASVLLDGDTAVVRTQQHSASLDRDNLAFGLGTMGLERIDVVNGMLNDTERAQLVEVAAINGTATADRSVLNTLAGRFPALDDPINLLQGSFRPKRPTSASNSAWQVTGALAAGWFVVALLVLTGQGIWASIQADELEANSRAFYEVLFPGERNVRNLKRSFQQHLGQRTQNDGSKRFIDFVGDAAAVLDDEVKIMSVSYNEGRGELSIDLLLKRYEDLDKLKSQFGERGVNVEIISAEQVEGSVRSRLRLGA